MSCEAQGPGQGPHLPKSKAGATEEWTLPVYLGEGTDSMEKVGRKEQRAGKSSPASWGDQGGAGIREGQSCKLYPSMPTSALAKGDKLILTEEETLAPTSS